MNKEIKFRIWNNKTNKWIHGPGQEVSLFGWTILLGELLKGVPVDEINDCVALQYTGLKDSFGTEIYEGDVLMESINNETQINFGVCKQVLGGWKIFSYSHSSINWNGWKSKVVWNIYSNKEANNRNV